MTWLAKILSVLITLSLLAVTATAGAPEASEFVIKTPDLRWRKVLIPVSFSNSLLKASPAIRPDSDIQGAIRRSLDAWEAVANIEFQVSWTDRLSVSPAGNTGDGTNLVTIAQTAENLLVFGGDSNDIPARTRVFFNRRSEISEADIVLNPYQQFSTDGSIGTFDFESTLTHEIGHLLGLEHSTISGATMHEQQGKNGTFNLSNFSPRTLSEDDVSQIRSIYGARDEADCCGSIDGKITFTGVKTAKNLNLWLEAAETGRVVTGTKISSDGSFQLRGLPAGKYSVYAQDTAGTFGGQTLGEVEVYKGKTAGLLKKIVPSAKDFAVQFTGFNGQLSKLAIPINGGKSYMIYFAGKNLNPDELKIGSTSPFFTVSSSNIVKYDYGKDISVFSVEIKSTSETPVGEYTIFLQKADGKTEFLPGNLAVEKFVNSFSNITFD